jgi:FkbM family methyltransferase
MEKPPPVNWKQLEKQLVWKFFDCAKHGVFVEVGANHPTIQSQTWLLEQNGWSGVLVEPNPELCELLRAQRPRSRTFQAAAGRPDQGGEVDLFMGKSDLHSTLVPIIGEPPLSGAKVRVQLRTLDSILAEASVEKIDFLSVDVEGTELDVLDGLNLEKYAPRLILLEEHRLNYSKHFYLRRRGYRLVKRTDINNWYVPNASPATIRSLNTPVERLWLFRKMVLNVPIRILRRKIKLGLLKRDQA